MPLYEYERIGGECQICGGRFAALQPIGDDPLTYCPTCGMEVRKLVSKASIAKSSKVDYQKAAQRGLTTFRKSGKGTWEKISGKGVDAIVGESSSLEKPKSGGKLDLDKES